MNNTSPFLSAGSHLVWPRRNQAPIALIGGFTAWGREEVFGFKYWGGADHDIQEDLKSLGFDTVTLPVGPFASNWDRACEAYAMLKGGQVDYGEAHAARHGHARFGRRHPGLIPEWGEQIPSLHLVAHSQGGRTARVLAQLLAQGDDEERRRTLAPGLSPLFRGGHDWILSITTLATPHDGTTLTVKHEGLVAPAQRLLALLTSLGRRGRRPLYDFKLDQWGIARAPEESSASHARRVFACPLWRGSRDFCAWDLSLEGAQALNGWVKAAPRTFHFSWSTAKTQATAQGPHRPLPRMTPLWIPGSRFMGCTTRSTREGLPIDASWFRNDGVVNTRSMAGPSGEEIRAFDGTPHRGLWNHMGVLEGWDHSEILGIGPEHEDEVPGFYRRWAAFLGALEG